MSNFRVIKSVYPDIGYAGRKQVALKQTLQMISYSKEVGPEESGLSWEVLQI